MIGHRFQHVETFTRPGPAPLSLRYLLYLPESYEEDKARRWPLILFLHGAGERGTNIELVRGIGLAKVVDQRPDFPFIVLSPQCPRNDYWSPGPLATLLDHIEATQRVDPDRVYVTGLSMGGYGTWEMAIAYPQRFAAIAPICGGGDPDRVCAIASVPVWAFHGAKDDVVPIRESEKMVAALRECGGNVRFTVYPDAGHDSWTPTYANPELYSWFLSHPRSRGAG
jgi:predicted peptidase